MQVTFDHSQPESSDITTYYFAPRQPCIYTAGQFIELVIPHEHSDKRGIKRWFTLSSSPTEKLLSITTKQARQSSSTFKQALRNLTPGIDLHMSEPMGDFVLPKLLQTPLLFVAAGIGITPYRSIITWLHDSHEVRPIEFIYAVKSEEDIIFQPIFDNANIRPTVIVAKPSDAWGGERGRISAELILHLGTITEETLIYVSGPEHLVEEITRDLQKHAFPHRRIVTDYFHGYDEVN